jgi:hypothetical protein
MSVPLSFSAVPPWSVRLEPEKKQRIEQAVVTPARVMLRRVALVRMGAPSSWIDD